ncbi:MAG: ABC transporter permease subunit [Gammaproteobacteria bacterium]|nr:ABC transporter permease subunit [Gammaproteobacteria bacterium]
MTDQTPQGHRSQNNRKRARSPINWLRGWSHLFFLYLYAPIIVLIIYSFNDNRIAQVWTEFSTKWYVKAFTNEDIQRAIINSLKVAFVATIVATLFATMAALVLSRPKFRGQVISNAIISLPLLVPEIATAVATLSFFAAIKFPLGLTSIIIAHIVFCIPFAFMPIRARLAGMDQTLQEAGKDLYANEWQVFYYVTLPMLKPGIIAGAILAFIISVDDFIISLMVAGAGATTLPLYIYSMIRLGVSPEINAVSTVLFSISVSAIAAYWLISRQTEDKTHVH